MNHPLRSIISHLALRLRPGKHAADRARLPSKHPEVRYR
jgi:hypothetical protein